MEEQSKESTLSNTLTLRPDKLRQLLLSENGQRTAAKLSLAAPSKQIENALIGTVDGAEPEEINRLINLLFQHQTLTKLPELLWHVLRNADATGLAALHRNVFPDLYESGVEYQALYTALTLSNDHERNTYLSELKTLLENRDLSAIKNAADKILNISVPNGYQMVNPYIGAGKSSRISLLKKTDSHTLYVWKLPANDSDKIIQDFKRLIERSRVWNQLGLSKGQISWGPDKKSLLQPYVEGATLRQAFNNTDLLTDPDHELLLPLIEMFHRLASHKLFISGLNSENLIFSESSWRIIDSGSIVTMGSPRLAWTRQYKKLSKHWTRFDNIPIAATRIFLKRIETRLNLPEQNLFGKVFTKLSLKITRGRKHVE